MLELAGTGAADEDSTTEVMTESVKLGAAAVVTGAAGAEVLQENVSERVF